MEKDDNLKLALEEIGIQRNCGVREGTPQSEDEDYYLNLHADMPTCIVEMGFINNSKDNKLFDANVEAYGAAILETDAAYENLQAVGKEEQS